MRDLKPRERALLQALDQTRDEEARRRNTPPFKVAGAKALIAIAKAKPRTLKELEAVRDVPPMLIKRLGRKLLTAVEAGMQAVPPVQAARPKRMSADARERLERLTAWRKNTAVARGVESDVVLHRDTLFELAQLNPETEEELKASGLLGPRRFELYAESLLAELGSLCGPETDRQHKEDE